VFALDGRGQRVAEVPVTGDTAASFDIGAAYSTVWYEAVFADAAPEGEGDRILDACGGYCDRVLEALPGCYPDKRACLDDCGYFTAVTLGGYCDCDADLDGFFACDEASDAETRVCGRLSQSIPPSYDCFDAYMAAYRCASGVPPCEALSRRLIDDFEDGDATAGRLGFGDWMLYTGDGSTTTDPFAPEAHGANGSLLSGRVRGNVDGVALLMLYHAGSPVDLSAAEGIAFSARGTGLLRVSVGTEAMETAENWDLHGMDVELGRYWRRYIIRFDDPRFGQGHGLFVPQPFTPESVTRLDFMVNTTEAFDFSIDDVEVLEGAQ
jgi:hypothetical protein